MRGEESYIGEHEVNQDMGKLREDFKQTELKLEKREDMGMGGGAGRYSKTGTRMVAMKSLSGAGLRKQIWGKEERKKD